MTLLSEFSRLHEDLINPADTASNNYIFVCNILIQELRLHSLSVNPTYILTDFSASEMFDNHKSVLTSSWIQANNERLDLPNIYFAQIPNKPYSF